MRSRCTPASIPSSRTWGTARSRPPRPRSPRWRSSTVWRGGGRRARGSLTVRARREWGAAAPPAHGAPRGAARGGACPARPAARSWITAELLRPQVMSVMPGAALTLPVTWTGRRREAGALPRLGCRRPLDRVGDPPDHEGYRRLHRTSRGRARLECPMPETLCTAGDVELCYETFGDHS